MITSGILLMMFALWILSFFHKPKKKNDGRKNELKEKSGITGKTDSGVS